MNHFNVKGSPDQRSIMGILRIKLFKHLAVMLILSFLIAVMFADSYADFIGDSGSSPGLAFLIGVTLSSTLIPLILVSIPAGVYKHFKKGALPGFFIVLWGLWVVMRALVLIPDFYKDDGRELRDTEGNLLELHNEVLYRQNTKTPFTGVAVAKHDNGQNRLEFTCKDGKKDGLETYWYRNGQKHSERTFKDDKVDGLTIFWYKNGQKSGEATWQDGWMLTGTAWKPNGEKCLDTNYVNGNGTVCEYYENGQKKNEATLKDGKSFSVKSWDEDGNPKYP